MIHTSKITLTDIENNEVDYYLVKSDKSPKSLVRIGSGRNAVVFLGSTNKNSSSEKDDFLAFKFLKNDKNDQFAKMSAFRFEEEILYTRSLGRTQNFFVEYRGVGFVGKNNVYSKIQKVSKSKKIKNSDLEWILEHYNLQGDFYVMNLCDGSLEHVFENKEEWFKLMPNYKKSVSEKHHVLYSSVLFDEYDKLRKLLPHFKIDKNIKSGYDILNAFKPETKATKIRNIAVLELFKRIVGVVKNLHLTGEGLAHRDLKLANIFLTHPYNANDFGKYDLKLADLGYTTQTKDHSTYDSNSDSSELVNWRTPGALVPGSQYYRAPEQAKLPLEVRININKEDKKKVTFENGKIRDIEVGDNLILSDHFGAVDKARLNYLIKDVKYDNGDYTLTLEDRIEVDDLDDLQAFVIKATGMHTDGFSLGAILYDLISGGKNPADFYTYFLAPYHSIAGDSRIEKVDEIINEMYDYKFVKTPEFIKNISTGKLNDLKRHSYYVEDKRDELIDKSIMKLIVKCMVRGLGEDSFYNSKDKFGYNTSYNQVATRNIYTEVEKLFDEKMKNDDMLKIINYNQIDNLLLRLRLFWQVMYNDKSNLKNILEINNTRNPIPINEELIENNEDEKLHEEENISAIVEE